MELTKQRITEIDSQNMWGLMNDFPTHWESIMESTSNVSLNIQSHKISSICLAGMGGSAIGADIIRAYTSNTCPVPVQVVRHYDIPNWVNESTLFIACSFSGNTEETHSALDQAIEKGAQIIGVTSGGELQNKAEKNGFDYIKIPGGMPPRAALAYSFVPLFRIFQWLGFIQEGDKQLIDTLEQLKEGVSLYTDISDNDALSIARELNDTLPVIYSDALSMEPINLRWRGQIEENAKMLAYGNVIPEMNHNEIVGWESIAHLTGRLTVVMLRDNEDNQRVQRRMDIVKELVIDQVNSVIEIQTKGHTKLARLFSLIQLGDWVSMYLGLINEIDATPIAKIDLLKSKLAEV
ncbi:MAG: bifunctional phosphoglucose/phosphomannose isomerase [Bacteroidota bacterium]